MSPNTCLRAKLGSNNHSEGKEDLEFAKWNRNSLMMENNGLFGAL